VGNGIRENIFFVQLKERSGLESLRGQLTGILMLLLRQL